MRNMRYGVGVILPILAMNIGESAAFEFKPEAQILFANSVAGDTESDIKLLFDAMAGGRVKHSFEFERFEFDAGAQLRLRVLQSLPSRPGFAGRLGLDCSECTHDSRAAVSVTTGLAARGTALSESIRFVPELARVWIRGHWGEVFGGLDAGVADFLDARPKRLFSEIGSISGNLDPTGLDGVRSANDISGTGAKIGYTSPRVLGFKAGFSWTPGQASGVKRYLPPDDTMHASPDLRHIVELGVSFARRAYSTGVRTRVALTYSTGSDFSPYDAYGQYHAVGTGLEIEYRDFHYGFRWLYSNNAWVDSGSGDYHALETSLSYKINQWRVGVEFGWSDDRLIQMQNLTYGFGIAYEVNEFFRLALGYVSGQMDLERNDEITRLRGAGPSLEFRMKLP